MNAQTNREQTLLQAALEWPTPAERAAFLKGACGDDEAIRQRVESLRRA
jgi:hypothetical protein